MNDRPEAAVTVPCPFCLATTRVAAGAERPPCDTCGRPLLLDRPVAVHDGDLEAVLRGTDVTVLVDFYADWCAPCKMMAPVLDQLAADHTGAVLVAKLDTDRNPTMAIRFGIRGIPSLLAFRHGREVARETGAVPRDRLEALLARAAEVDGPGAEGAGTAPAGISDPWDLG